MVTGTLSDGSLTLGQEVEILPPGLKARIRGLQTHKSQLNSIGPGNRVAVNLVGLNPSDLQRGFVLTRPGWLKPTEIIDARLRLLAQPDRPLRHNTEVSLFTGSAEVAARIRLLEVEEALPGETTWVQFILEGPLAVVNGDHYVIRSPMDTLGGGIVVESHPQERHRRFQAETIANLRTRSEGKTEQTLLAALKSKQPQELAALMSQSNLPAEIAQDAIDTLVQQAQIVAIGEGPGSLLFTESGWRQVADNVLAAVREYHRRYPLRSGIPRAEITNKIKLGTRSAEILQKLITDGALVEVSAQLRLPDHQIKLAPAQQTKMDAYLRQLDQNPFSPAPDLELEPDLLNLLIDRGLVVKTGAGVVFAAKAYGEMVNKVLDHIRRSGKITVGETRDMFGSSRKYVMAFLEHLDEKKITKRVGDERVLGPAAATS